MEAWNKASLAQLPQVRALGRHTGRDPLTLFWTASGIELDFTGSALWVDFFADYTAVEPWVSVELNGAWIARFARCTCLPWPPPRKPPTSSTRPLAKRPQIC